MRKKRRQDKNLQMSFGLLVLFWICVSSNQKQGEVFTYELSCVTS